MNTKQLTYPTIESQKQFWIDKEAQSDNATPETRGDLMFRYHNDPLFHRFVQEMIAHAIHRYEERHAQPQIPNGTASTTADPKPEDLSRTESLTDWYDHRDDDYWSLRDEGRKPLNSSPHI